MSADVINGTICPVCIASYICIYVKCYKWYSTFISESWFSINYRTLSCKYILTL